jgi:2-phosphosulfolactate phosphatase
VRTLASIQEAADYEGVDKRLGECGNAKARGFGFGDSPTEIEAAELPPGATVVLSITNGTRVIEAAQGASMILAGAFVNADAVANELASGTYGERVAVIECGCEGRRTSEGESAAGVILYRLRERGVRLYERARWVVDFDLARPEKSLLRNGATRRLVRLGHERDIDFRLAENIVPVVPRLKGDTFVSRP